VEPDLAKQGVEGVACDAAEEAARFTRAAAQPGWRLSADADLRSQSGENLVVLGEAALLLLREDEPSVRDDVVLALRALEGLGIEALLR
jgi:hypothetical protein